MIHLQHKKESWNLMYLKQNKAYLASETNKNIKYNTSKRNSEIIVNDYNKAKC